jgi:chromosome segregation ATPase
MDEQALERAKRRIAEARAGRADSARIDAALDRSRAQLEALAAAASELEDSLPGRVGDAVREGLRTEVVPVARSLAEIRGLLNQANRRLERLEQDVLAERHARVDDLALLVDLVSSGWRGVDERLRRLEQTAPGAKVVPLPRDATAA